ncbi:Glycosyl hydrolase family 32 domain protein [Caldithrix abyssi DSM 13497]|uniref:Glycosyl hydrolase family 32 domain protein n=1 Tax=Caldithrix abyssi DSM 13497 TaxID=880073 RepID=H1XXV2_CALAY|nr:T9SS type A sorting domain-containing protein [Caldithrix abyssi]APF19659.1 Por secretion system C-terminal sorting domain-containing protein [Caldithrix abyssi DSM 13497]EHO39775.1 Glycosyl hydrolase family 32 domain protein [Caldithrix abyssi DSM 13497]
MKTKQWLFILFLTVQVGFAQEPPGWVNTGNLQDATFLKDFLQLPWNPDIVLACGADRTGSYHAGLWKSNDKAQSWEYKFWVGESYDYFTEMRLDSSKYRIWLVGKLTYSTLQHGLYYSMDDGENWTSVDYPDAIENIGDGYAIGIVNSHIYYGGTSNNSTQIKLYRYNTSSSNPGDWAWEYVNTFQDADGIPHIFTEGNYAYPCVRANDRTKIKIYKVDDASKNIQFISTVNLTFVQDFIKNKGDYFIAGDSAGIARIYKSADLINWTKVGEWMPGGDNTYVESVLFYNDTLFASMRITNENLTIYKSPDKGGSWIGCYNPAGVNNSFKLRLIDNEMWVATGHDYGDIFKATWNVQTGGDYQYGPTYVFTSRLNGNDLYFTTNYKYGEVYKKSGTSPAEKFATFADANQCFSIEWDQDTILVATDGGNLVKRSDDGGSTWKDTFKPQGASDALSLKKLESGQLILGTDWYGDVFLSTNRFATGGTYLYGPTFVYKSRNHNDLIYFTTDYTNGEIYTVDTTANVSLWKNFSDATLATDLLWESDTIFVALDAPNLIKKSTDGGNSWEDVFKPQGASHVLSMIKTINKKMFIGTDWLGDVFLATDRYETGGTYLYGPNYVFDIKFCGETGYIATNYDNGEIWKTEDGGVNWANLTKYLQPWSQVFSLVTFGNTIYAGTDYNGDVYKSEDGGQSWVATGDLLNASEVLSLHLSTDAQRNKIFAGTGWYGDVFISDEEVMTLEAPEIVLEPKFTQGTNNTVYCRNNGSDGYQFEMASDSMFNDILKRSPVTTDTFYTFTNLYDGKTYYYRVYGRNCSYSSKASSTTFSTQDAKAPKIYAESPTNRTWINDSQPEILAHLKDDGIGVDTTAVTMMVDSISVQPQVITPTKIKYDPPASLKQGWHTVIVTAKDYFDQSSEFSWQFAVDVEKPTIPKLISPTDSAILATQSVTFHWQTSIDTLSGVKYYMLQYSIDPNFKNQVDTVITVQTNYSATLNDTTYYWKVTVFDSAGNSRNSNVWRVIIDAHAPDVPVLHQPVKGVWLASNNVLFSWDAVSKQTEVDGNDFSDQNEKILSTAVQYIIKVNKDTSIIIQDTVSVNEYQTRLIEGKYYWQVLAFDEAQNESGWTEVDSFGVDLTPPVIDSVTVLQDTANYFGPFEISAIVSDSIGEIDTTLLIYRFDSEPFDTTGMHFESSVFKGTIPSSDSTEHQISYFVITRDKVGQSAVSDTIIFNTLITGINDIVTNIPEQFVIKNLWPNPTNGALRLRFGLPKASHAIVEIYNVLGQRIWSKEQNYQAGWHELQIPADFPSGQYFIRLKTKMGERTVKGIIIK